MPQIVIACGTRPDVLKLAPLAQALHTRGVPLKVWWSGQGPDIFPEALRPLVDARAPSDWESLTMGVTDTIEYFTEYLDYLKTPPSLVIVHGDDATAYSCALAASLADIPIAHVEAGLRTHAHDPWPEELFRRTIAQLATLHFAPDATSARNLQKEGISPQNVHIVGNTVNDALRAFKPLFNVLVTCHRRENADTREDLLGALQQLASEAPLNIAVTTHPNWPPGIPEKFPDLNFVLPVDHETFLHKILYSDIVVTDSGGLQEECAYLGRDCIVYRAATERKLLATRGIVQIAPTPELVIHHINLILDRRLSYGKGDTGEQIAEILANHPK